MKWFKFQEGSRKLKTLITTLHINPWAQALNSTIIEVNLNSMGDEPHIYLTIICSSNMPIFNSKFQTQIKFAGCDLCDICNSWSLKWG